MKSSTNLLIIIFFAILYYFFTSVPTNRDEILYLELSRLDWSDIFSATAEHPHPPIYNFLLKLWCTIFGWSPKSGKIFSVFLLSATIPVIYSIYRLFFNRKFANIAVILVLINGVWLYDFTIIRNYSLFAFFSSISILTFFIWLNNSANKYLLLHTFFLMLNIFTHYQGVFLPLGFIVYIATLRKNTLLIKYFYAIIFIFSTILLYFYFNIDQLHTYPKASSGDFINHIGRIFYSLGWIAVGIVSGVTYIDLPGGISDVLIPLNIVKIMSSISLVILLIILILSNFIKRQKNIDKNEGSQSIFWIIFLSTNVILVGIIFLNHPYHYILGVLPLSYFMTLSIKSNKKIIQHVGILGLTIYLIISTISLINYKNNDVNGNPNWKEIISYINSFGIDRILVAPPVEAMHMRYYSPAYWDIHGIPVEFDIKNISASSHPIMKNSDIEKFENSFMDYKKPFTLIYIPAFWERAPAIGGINSDWEAGFEPGGIIRVVIIR